KNINNNIINDINNIFTNVEYKTSDELQRIILFYKNNNILHIRHYKIIKDNTDVVRVGLKEIGPRIDLNID
ncbi:putative Brix domain protein, partial [Spraguea lophii 42_110]